MSTKKVINGKEYDLLDTDWTALMNEADASGNYELASQYEQAKNEKILSPDYTGNVTETTSKYNQYSSDPWVKYAGTNYHQDAIDAAKEGNWTGAIEALGYRLEKSTAQGDDRGKTNQEIWDELWAEYGPKDIIFNTASTSSSSSSNTSSNSFDYDSSSRPTYSDNGLSARIDEMLNEILNRDAFSYNAEKDPLFKQYSDMYQREGKRAMNDAMASAAAQAGGMNSYAMTAAQQANNYYNAQLTDKIPELYQLAYEMYLQDIDNQVRDLGLLQDMDNTQYNRYRDTMSDWENDRNFAYNMYRDDVADNKWLQEFDSDNRKWQMEFLTQNQQSANKTAYDRAMEQIEAGIMPDDALLKEAGISSEKAEEWVAKVVAAEKLEKDQYDTEWGFETSKDAYNKAMDMIELGVMPDKDMLKAAGITAAQAAAMIESLTGKIVTVDSDDSDNGDTPKKTGFENSGMADAQIKAMQKALGVDVDGKWGPKSQAAAEAKGWGSSAADAWKSYTGTIDTSDDFQYLNNGHYNTQEHAAEAEVTNAIMDLGIGMVNEDTVWQMMQFGGIVEKDGKFVWANGWNKNNWQEKMAAAVKNGGIGLYAGVGVN